MNERLNVIRAAMWGAALGVVYWLYEVIKGEYWLTGGSEHLARAAGGLMGAIVGGAFMLALGATVINLLSRAK